MVESLKNVANKYEEYLENTCAYLLVSVHSALEHSALWSGLMHKLNFCFILTGTHVHDK